MEVYLPNIDSVFAFFVHTDVCEFHLKLLPL